MPPRPPDPMIRVEDLHRSFDGEPVLRGVNLQVEAGTTCVLLGMSGSGKTVLLKHLVGLLHPDKGRIWVASQEVTALRGLALERLRREVGILFQSDALFDSMTVFDNVAFGLREQRHLGEREVRTRVTEILEQVDLQDAQDLLPGVLSGGMRKRVAFARAAVGRPRVLLYDEPTAGLDPLTTESVIDIVASARKLGTTTLAVIFDVAAALRVGDQIALLHDGRIVASGPPGQFVHSPHPAVRAFLKDWLAQHPEAEARG